MIQTLLFDFARVLLFPKDKTYLGELNKLHRELSPNHDYHFLATFEFNTELLDYLETLKGKFELCIFTSGVIQNFSEIKYKVHSLFSQVFSAEVLNLSKADPHAYEVILEKIGKKADEVLFIDDSFDNCQAAFQVGIRTLRFTDNKQVIAELKMLGLNNNGDTPVGRVLTNQ